MGAELRRGEYARGRIVADEQEFEVVMEEWVDEGGRLVQRLAIKDVAFIDRFVNFELPAPGPPGFRPGAKGQTIVLDADSYNLLFSEVYPIVPL